jgi:hypothetical protein
VKNMSKKKAVKFRRVREVKIMTSWIFLGGLLDCFRY